MEQANRDRPIQVKFFVSKHEKKIIRRRMELAKTNNLSAFLRKMACDGMIINVDYSQINDICTHLGRISTSINQIAKRVNSTGRIYESDIAEIKRKQTEIVDLLNAMESKLL